MAQQIINTGAVANDGTGDPLRTAFTETNSNFTEIYTAGPVGSNVRIANNTILTINTNGNLVLAPNGVGVVQSNVNIVPNQANVRNLGSSTARWGTVYAKYVDITNGTIYSGDLTVTGNLSAATVTTPELTVNMIRSDDSTVVNIQDGVEVDGDVLANGNVTADYVLGDGSQLMNISVGNSGAVQFNWQGSLSNQGGTPGDTYSTLQFDSNGMPTLDGTTAYQQRVDYSPYLQVLAPRVESTDFDIVAGPGITVVGYDDNYNIPRSAYLSVQDQANATQQWDFGILGNGSNNYSISDRTNSNTWTFGITGDLSAPGNVSAGNVLTSAEVIASGVIQTGTGFSTGGYLSVNGSTDLHDTNIIGNLSVNTIRSDDSTIVLIQDGVEIDGDAVINGNVTGAYILGNGSQLTGLPAIYGNANVTALLGNLGSNVISGTGNITTTANVSGAYVKGNGSALTNLPAPTVTQDIASTGDMSIMTYDGNLKYVNYATVEPATGNIKTAGNISATGNVTGSYILGNGSQLANITANSTQVTYSQGDAGSVQRTVASKFQETASVKDFGAVGDGVTNDTAAITAAITATTSGTLIFPEGSYLINNSTGPFTVSSFQGEMIFLGNAKLLFNTNTQAGIVFSGGSNAKIYNIRIDYVTPPTSRTNAQEGIAFYSTTDTTVTGVYVESSPAAGLLFGQCIRPQVSGVVIESSQADGVHFNNCQDPQIDNLITVSTGDDGLAFVNYASQSAYLGGTATNIIIKNSKARGIAVVGQSNVTINNFLVDGTASSGIFTAYDSAYSTRYPANVIWSDGIVRNAGTVTPLVGNQFGIEYADVVSVKYNNIKVINSASRGMSGTTTANGLVEASDITVDSATTNNGFNLSGDNISIDNLFANNIQSYGIYISNSTNVQATNLKTLNVSKGGGLNRAVWFDTVVQLLTDGIEVIDNQGSATGYIVGSANCTRGSVSSINFAIANGTGQINPVGSGISYPLTNYGTNSTNILFGTGTISGTGNITAGNIIANNLGNIASINLNGNASTVLYGNGVFAAAAASSSYGNANVATFLAAYGSNAISTSGNITAGNFVGNGAALTNVTVSAAGNIVGTSPNVSLVAGSYTYTFDNVGAMTLPAAATGNEGGEIQFTQAANSTLSGNTITIDNYVDQIRFFEGGGTSRGVYIDLTQAAAGVGTLLNNRVSAFVNAGTFVTMDNIKATVTTSANRGLSLATVSGSFAYDIGGTYGTAIPSSGGSAGTGTLTTTPTASIFNWGFTNQGDLSTYIITNTSSLIAYRITLQIGSGFNNNMISIERLI